MKITFYYGYYTLNVTTDSNGIAQYSQYIQWGMSYTVSVTNVTHGSDVYDPGQNQSSSVTLSAR